MYEAKDYQRVQDINTKSKGARSRMISLASTMANKITDKEKCYRRYEASLAFFGANHSVTNIFIERYQALTGGYVAYLASFGANQSVTNIERYQALTGGYVAPPAPAAPVVTAKKESAPEIKVDLTGVVFGSTLVQPEKVDLKKLEVKKGKLKTGIVEVWKTWTQDIVHLFRERDASDRPVKTITNFYDEAGTFLFGGELVDWVEAKFEAAAEKKYGASSEKFVA